MGSFWIQSRWIVRRDRQLPRRIVSIPHPIVQVPRCRSDSHRNTLSFSVKVACLPTGKEHSFESASGLDEARNGVGLSSATTVSGPVIGLLFSRPEMQGVCSENTKQHNVNGMASIAKVLCISIEKEHEIHKNTHPINSKLWFIYIDHATHASEN